MRVLDAGRRQPVDGLSFSPDGLRLAYGLSSSVGGVFDLASGGAPTVLHGGLSINSRHLVFGPGPVLHTITYQGRTGLDPGTGEVVSVGPADPDGLGYCWGFGQSADGSRLVTVHQVHGTSWLNGWDALAGGWERAWHVAQGTGSGLAVSAAGDRVAQIGVLSPRQPVYHLLIRDAATGELVTGGRYPYTMLARPRYRPDGRQIVAVRGMALVVWDPTYPGKPQVVRNDTRRDFTAAAYHPSGRYLFTTSNDATVTVWDTNEWVRVKRFAWDVGRLRSVAVSPDGLLAAAGSDRGRVVVWDVDV